MSTKKGEFFGNNICGAFVIFAFAVALTMKTDTSIVES